MQKQNYSPEEISKIGEEFYFKELQKKLEPEHNGEYVVIDVDLKKYIVNSDMLKALEEAKSKFGEKLFHIIQIGGLQKPTINYKVAKYAWKF